MILTSTSLKIAVSINKIEPLYDYWVVAVFTTQKSTKFWSFWKYAPKRPFTDEVFENIIKNPEKSDILL